MLVGEAEARKNVWFGYHSSGITNKRVKVGLHRSFRRPAARFTMKHTRAWAALKRTSSVLCGFVNVVRSQHLRGHPLSPPSFNRRVIINQALMVGISTMLFIYLPRGQPSSTAPVCSLVPTLLWMNGSCVQSGHSIHQNHVWATNNLYAHFYSSHRKLIFFHSPYSNMSAVKVPTTFQKQDIATYCLLMLACSPTL